MNISQHDLLQIDLGLLVNKEAQHDVKFLLGKDEVVRYGHSLILSARCPYFAIACQGPWKEVSEGIFRKPNIEPEVFDIILQYLYTGKLEASSTIIPPLIEAALELQLSHMVKACEEFACQIITEENVYEIMALSSQYDLLKLWSKALDFFDEHVQSLVEDDGLYVLESDILSKVLSRDSVRLEELTVWEAIVRYSWHTNGMGYRNCPLLQFPQWPGRLIVKVSIDDEVDHQELPVKNSGSGDWSDEPCFVDMNTCNTKFGTIQEQDAVVNLSQVQFSCLRATIQPLLRAVRFASLGAINFARCIEGTGFLPVSLCLSVYRYYSLPAGSPHDFASPRFQGSAFLPRGKWSTLASWVRNTNPQGTKSSSPKFVRLYKASVHGFEAETFHRLCDQKGSTLTIVQACDGVVVGGYNGSDWASDSSWSSANKNFLFHFNPESRKVTYSSLPSDKREYACLNSPYYGPIFGLGRDLQISKDGKTVSTNSRSYNTDALWPQGSRRVSDYEVFTVTYEKLEDV